MTVRHGSPLVTDPPSMQTTKVTKSTQSYLYITILFKQIIQSKKMMQDVCMGETCVKD